MDDLTKFDPNEDSLHKEAPCLREFFSGFPKEISEHALCILEVLLTRGDVNHLVESATWLLENVTIDFIEPDSFNILFNHLGSYLVDQQMVTKRDRRLAETGLQFFKKCEETLEKSQFHYNIANAYSQLSLSDYDKKDFSSAQTNHRLARKHLIKCLEINPTSPSALANLASNYSFTGRDLETIEICNRAISHKSDHQMAYGLKGETLFHLAFTVIQVTEALKCLEIAASFKYKTCRILYFLAACHDRLGNKEKALEIYNQCIEYPPDFFTQKAKENIEFLKGTNNA